LLLFPINYLDFPFMNRTSFLGLTPTIFVVARKPALEEGA